MILWNETIKKKVFPLSILYSDLVLHEMREFSRVTLTDVIGASNNWYTVTDINQQISR